MAAVDFFFSPGSRYSYLAASQIPKLEAETGCEVEWRPVNGVAIRRLRGTDPFAGAPVSGQYDWAYRERDARLWAQYYGIAFREPPAHHFDFDLLARAAISARRLGEAAEYGWRLCSTVFGSDVWPIDEGVCVDVAVEVGMPADRFHHYLNDPQTDQMLEDAAAEANRRGAFGVPSFFVGDELFWGNDRIPLLKDYLKRNHGH